MAGSVVVLSDESTEAFWSATRAIVRRLEAQGSRVTLLPFPNDGELEAVLKRALRLDASLPDVVIVVSEEEPPNPADLYGLPSPVEWVSPNEVSEDSPELYSSAIASDDLIVVAPSTSRRWLVSELELLLGKQHILSEGIRVGSIEHHLLRSSQRVAILAETPCSERLSRMLVRAGKRVHVIRQPEPAAFDSFGMEGLDLEVRAVQAALSDLTVQPVEVGLRETRGPIVDSRPPAELSILVPEKKGAHGAECNSLLSVNAELEISAIAPSPDALAFKVECKLDDQWLTSLENLSVTSGISVLSKLSQEADLVSVYSASDVAYLRVQGEVSFGYTPECVTLRCWPLSPTFEVRLARAGLSWSDCLCDCINEEGHE